jgi:hypothetical protein
MLPAQSGSALRSSLLTIGVIVMLLALAASLLPRGFSDDVTRIGHGANAAVLVHNKEAVLSQELMTLLNRVRSDYEPGTLFLAVDIATPQGREFAQAQGVGDGVVLLFGPDGSRRGAISAARDEASLRAALDAAFGAHPAQSP